MSTGSTRRCLGDGDLSINLSDVAERTSLRRQFLSTAYVASWPEASARFVAAIVRSRGLSRHAENRSTGAIDPFHFGPSHSLQLSFYWHGLKSVPADDGRRSPPQTYLQANTSEIPSCLAIPFAVCTAVRKESSLMVFDC